MHLNGDESAVVQEFQRLEGASSRRRHPGTFWGEARVMRRRYPETFEHMLRMQMSPNFLAGWAHMGVVDTALFSAAILLGGDGPAPAPLLPIGRLRGLEARTFCDIKRICYSANPTAPSGVAPSPPNIP